LKQYTPCFVEKIEDFYIKEAG